MKCGAPALKTHITGCLVHGSQLYLYTDLLQWPHDPNLTITCLVNAITSNTNVLPPKLYVQCDNCGRENKNKYVIGFLGYLCLSGYVKEVLIYVYMYVCTVKTMNYQIETKFPKSEKKMPHSWNLCPNKIWKTHY